jgi:hypothetical protein
MEKTFEELLDDFEWAVRDLADAHSHQRAAYRQEVEELKEQLLTRYRDAVQE